MNTFGGVGREKWRSGAGRMQGDEGGEWHGMAGVNDIRYIMEGLLLFSSTSSFNAIQYEHYSNHIYH